MARLQYTGSERIRMYRESQGWSFREMAKRAGISSHVLIHMIEKGTVRITDITAQKLASVMGIKWHVLCKQLPHHKRSRGDISRVRRNRQEMDFEGPDEGHKITRRRQTHNTDGSTKI